MKINLGCGRDIMKGYVNVDRQKLDGVDIIHELEQFPYPFKDGSADHINATMILEHLCPKNTIRFMDECWRILQAPGTMFLGVPIAGTWLDFQDPTHCNHIGDWTMKYFDPRYKEYDFYTPKPWHILEQKREICKKGKFVNIPIDCLEISLEKRTDAEYFGEKK